MGPTTFPKRKSLRTGGGDALGDSFAVADGLDGQLVGRAADEAAVGPLMLQAGGGRSAPLLQKDVLAALHTIKGHGGVELDAVVYLDIDSTGRCGPIKL